MARGNLTQLLMGAGGQPTYVATIGLSTTAASATIPASTNLLLQSDVECYVTFGGTTATTAQGVRIAAGAPGMYVLTKHDCTCMSAIVASGTGSLVVSKLE